ncbi:MAG: hypothetical protein IPK98_11825 [Chloracidobacterium sp.]|nr:hypothetical protein [Chloracidobacterium sp.]
MNLPIFDFTTTRKFAAIAILASFILTNAFAVGALRGERTSPVTVSAATAKYTTDLTQLGREGRLREELSYEKETTRLIKVLAEGGSRQPVIVDEDAAVQATIVEQVALRIANGSAPEKLAKKTILKIETATLFSNAKSQPQIAAIVNAIANDAANSNGQIILFADELTSLVGKNAAETNFFNLIAEGKILMIGGSSVAAYDENIASQPNVAEHFAGITVSGKTQNSDSVAVKNDRDSGYRGDIVSPDLRDMMAQDPSGNKRVDVILQAKDADNAAFRSLLASGQARIADRIGNDDTLVVNLPLSTVSNLSTSGLINYVSPDRPTTMTRPCRRGDRLDADAFAAGT